MDLDWCLTCSRHTSGGLYCSDSCRLKDIDASTPIISYQPYSASPRLTLSASTTTTATADTTAYGTPSTLAATITAEPYTKYNISMPTLTLPKSAQPPSKSLSYCYLPRHNCTHNSDCREFQYTVQRMPVVI
ncbi:6610_t:CDS:2 [Paraglomus brasilianum]|uniref:6610_t:CDS:1 n=1 Tax=Paraglomus brasilianum TaxID=144538 RepID=A0A9N9B9X2_9GLOM|nr:6610_t:CDS:2 [Paraglomus brasilianum]